VIERDEGFHRRLKAAGMARVVPWPAIITRDVLDIPLSDPPPVATAFVDYIHADQ
jgi:hypothetical protein